MDKKQQALQTIERIKSIRPPFVLEEMKHLNSGMMFVLFYLAEANEEVFATTLCEKMHISRARIAMLLKKLLTKGFISKSPSINDARKDVLKITNRGLNHVETAKENLLYLVMQAIDKIGLEKINTFIDIASELKETMVPPSLDGFVSFDESN